MKQLWRKYQLMVLRNCKNPLDHEANLSYWRDFLFASILIYLIPLIGLLIVPGLIFFYIKGIYTVIYIDVLMFSMIGLIAFMPNISVSLRKILFCSIAYIQSIVLIYFIGYMGIGLIYLLALSVIYIAIFPNKFAFWPIYFVAGFGILYTIVIEYDLLPLHESIRGKTFEWIVLLITLLLIISIFSLLLPQLFDNMEKTINNQRKLQVKLNNKNLELIESEEKLRLLNRELESRVQKRTKDLEDVNMQLATFSYSISHDLQAPLRAIKAYTFALEKECKDNLSEEGKDYLVKILSSTNKMTILIQSLLKFSKLKKQVIVKDEINLNTLVKAVWLNLNYEKRDDSKVEFILKDLPMVEGDSILIEQVMENLLTNALKYSSKKECPKIEVGVNNGNIYVKDNGVGFDISNHNRIFSIFKRLHTEKEFEGNGVGLSIVKLIIEKHGGKIWAESEVDKGATFYFNL